MAYSEADVLAGLAEIVNEETGLETEAVEANKSFTDDLDIDSISMMTIVVNAEKKFGVKIPDDDVKDLVTVQDAVDYIVKAQQALSASSPRGRRPRPRGGPTQRFDEVPHHDIHCRRHRYRCRHPPGQHRPGDMAGRPGRHQRCAHTRQRLGPEV
jgi:acyl carrier protein